MYHLFSIQLLCGAFCAYVAHRRGASAIVWGLVGFAVPVLGLVACLSLAGKHAGAARGGRKGATTHPPQRPASCNGRYQPVCFGCPFFRRALFEARYDESKKGRCTFYGVDLIEQSGRRNGQTPQGSPQ